MGGGFSVVTAVVRVQSLAQEILHAMGVAKKLKKKKKKTGKQKEYNPAWIMSIFMPKLV